MIRLTLLCLLLTGCATVETTPWCGDLPPVYGTDC